MRTRTRAVTLMAAAALVLAGCGTDGEDPDGGIDPDPGTGTEPDPDAGTDPDTGTDFPEGSTMAALAEAGTITIGTKFDQPLFGLVDPGGTPEGFDVEIGRLIAAELGIGEDGIDWVETISANREPYIQDGRVDIVIATYTINDTRKEVVDFAGPYYEAGQSLLVLSTNEDITGPDDLDGAIVCSVEGSTPAENIRDNFPEAELALFGAYSDCLEPLRNGQVDAISTDNVILAGYAAESADFQVVGEPFTAEPYGIGLALGDEEFRNWINDVLEAIYDDGRWVAAWEETAGTVLPTPDPPAVDRY